MVGLGPTIHEFLSGTVLVADELMDGRAKHDHDGLESGLEPGCIAPPLVRWPDGSRITPLTRLPGMTEREVEVSPQLRDPPAHVSRETRKSVTT